MGKPVIASVRGAAAGFGVGLVAACDLAIASSKAFFTLAYCHIGASPDGGSSYFLGRTLGMKQQMELAFLGDRFSSERAEELGIVNWVVPDEELDAETHKLAVRLPAAPLSLIQMQKNYSIKQIICRWNHSFRWKPNEWQIV